MPITLNTVLILGAGASAPYGFPLGKKLRDQVCGFADHRGYKFLFGDMGHPESELRAFVDELKFSPYTSVDVFLENNPDFLTIGKRAIAAALFPLEQEDRLFPPGVDSDKSWYESLILQMSVGTDAWLDNNLSVVTFNYDRSFEHYFVTVLKNRGHLSTAEAMALFERVEVVHVHGSLGEYPGVPYGACTRDADLSPEAMKAAAESIIVISEAGDNLSSFDRAEASLRQARRIYFLGFGFHPTNVRRLRIFEKKPSDDDTWDVSGTSRGIPARHWADIETEVLTGHWTGPRNEIAVPLFITHFAHLR